jgi:branched-chain amino acid transport system ATP-binding protein
VTEPLLQVDKLHVAYGRVPAVRGIDLEVHRGEIVGLIGPNGAGKTTTLSAIFGLVRAASGRVRCRGVDLLGSAPELIVRHGLAIVPEGRHIFHTLTVAENLALGSTARSDKPGSGELDVILGRFPVLRKYYKSPAARLSGGEQQQLAIARALLSKPELLVLDEPSLGLAPKVVDLVFNILGELREEGTTVLLVEQNAARTLQFADRTYVLRTGQVALAGNRAELETAQGVTDAYLGSALI